VLADPWPPVVAALERAGHAVSTLTLTAAGVPTYSRLVIVVRVHEANYHGPLLRALMQALTLAERAVDTNRGAAAATLARANPKLGAALERLMLAQLAPVLAPPGHVFGYQNPYSWQTFGVWMRTYGLLHDSANAGLAITTEFLPGQGEPSSSP
jgi:ABC-type nitrate/sulfonate/bicarbonate transport system substrate-binding protein